MVKNSKKNTISKQFALVNIPSIIKCKNKKKGCSIKPHKRYTCYKRYKYKKNKTKKDIVSFSNRKKRTRKLKIPVILIEKDYMDCSHFD